MGNSRIPVNVRLVPLFDDSECQTISQSNAGLLLHAVIHKRTDDMAAFVTSPDSDAAARISCLERQISHLLTTEGQSFSVVVIDPLRKVWSTVDRREIFQAIDSVFKPSHPLFRKGNVDIQRLVENTPSNVTPANWVEVPMNKGLSAVSRAIKDRVKFPLILKRRLACGSKESHEMVIAYNMEGLLAAAKTVFHVYESGKSPDAQRDFISNIIAQEYIANHGGVIFKVYAIGSNVVVQARSSINPTPESSKTGYFHFDSQRVNQSEHHAFDGTTGRSQNTDAIMPSQKLASSTVSALSKCLGLTLLGVDLIYNVHSKKYHVVDINYFPGYKGVDMAYKWILQHICNLVNKELEHPRVLM